MGLAAGLSIILALILAGLGLVALFERHVERHIEAELRTYLLQLADGLVFTADGAPELQRALAHPRFDQPLSGLYWQIEDDATGTRLRSRSLWDFVVALPRTEHDPGTLHRYVLPGPNGTQLLVNERRISYADAEPVRGLRIMTAIDRQDIATLRREFAGDVGLALSLLATVLMLASAVQIAVGLKPLDAVRGHVADIRSGRQQRIAASGPAEVMPLVAEVNSLLDGQEQAIARARAHAADLAHGLKTPLTVLAADADRLRQRGETEIAAEIEELAGTMRRHIGRELSRVRLRERARPGPEPVRLAGIAQSIVRVIQRSPRGGKLAWSVAIPDDLGIAMRAEDLSELLGAVLENASKWAEHEVRVMASPGSFLETSMGAAARLVIEDDGPGISPMEIQQLGRRGVRLDQSIEGTGLGLAIATDIADAYGGAISYSLCEPHGFRVSITFSPMLPE